MAVLIFYADDMTAQRKKIIQKETMLLVCINTFQKFFVILLNYYLYSHEILTDAFNVSSNGIQSITSLW